MKKKKKQRKKRTVDKSLKVKSCSRVPTNGFPSSVWIHTSLSVPLS